MNTLYLKNYFNNSEFFSKFKKIPITMDDEYIIYGERKFRYTMEGKWMRIDPFIQNFLTDSNIIRFLSYKKLIFETSKDEQYFLLSNIKHSKIIVEMLSIRYSHECFDFSGDSLGKYTVDDIINGRRPAPVMTLTENSDYFDYITPSHTKVNIKHYKINHGWKYTINEQPLVLIVIAILSERANIPKIIVEHSEKFAGFEDGMEKAFRVEDE